jgi:hypothetical protein
MKTYLSVLLSTIATAAFSISAGAYSTDAVSELKPGSPPMDCTTWKDKARCEALNKDIAVCKDKIGDEWRECMHRPAPAAKAAPPKPRDCAKASNKERCEAFNAALEVCKDKATKTEHRKCMDGQKSAAAAK